ncbi:MAG: hypothetical protein ABJN34_16545 [Litoreibacter sp.]|uniref:GumC family protein n=1 Tax=Litoreibacter sp. TaxID=1969459 RepID=UPI00329A5C87
MIDSKTTSTTAHLRKINFTWLKVRRTPLRDLGWRRLLVGGRLSDLGRIPRYVAVVLIGASCVWAPILGYLATAPLQFSSHASLILPGSGASASVNLNEIGQASSYANSAFSNGSISPTETYKRLIGADRILDAAAKALDMDRTEFGKPRVTLVDQTSLIHIEVKGPNADQAQVFGDALLAALFAEIDALRADEIQTRETSGIGAIADYTRSVRETRAVISDLQARSGLQSAKQFREQVTSLDQLKQDLRNLEAELSRQSNKVTALEAALDLPSNSAAATLKLYADAQYLSLLEKVALHSATMAQAQASYGTRHPVRVSARDAYEGARSASLARASEVTGLPEDNLIGLDRAPEGQRAALLSELVRENATQVGLKHEAETLSAQVKDENARIATLSPIASELEDLQRDFDVAEAVFASAIARAESTKTDVYASYPLIQVLENPSLPDHPSSPRRKLSLAAGIAATVLLLIGLGLAWVRKPMISRLLVSPKAQAQDEDTA